MKIMALACLVASLLGGLSLYTVFVRPITLVSTERWIAIVNGAPDPWYRQLAVAHYWWSRRLFFGDAPLVIRPVDGKAVVVKRH